MEKPDIQTKKIAPKFSILIAVFNAETTLRRCLDSLLAQRRQDWEAICIDDCSTDHSASILREYAARDARFRLCRTQENSGHAAARNVGLKQVGGEWVFMLDSDDRIGSDALEILSRSISAHPQADCHLFRLVRVWETTDATPTGVKDEASPSQHNTNNAAHHINLKEAEPEVREEVWHNRYTDQDVWTGEEACRLSIEWNIHGLYAGRAELHRRFPYDTTTRLFSDDNTVRVHYLHSREVVQTDAAYYYYQYEGSQTHRAALSRLDFLIANRNLRTDLQGIPKSMQCILEQHCWKNFISIWRQYQTFSHTLSREEQRRARRIFSDCLRAMRPSLLPLCLRFHPKSLFLRPLWLFEVHQKSLLFFRRLIRGTKAARLRR